MSNQGPEAVPDPIVYPDEELKDGPPAEVVDLQTYMDEREPEPALEDKAAGVVGVTIERPESQPADEPVISYAVDRRQVETARRDPDAFDKLVKEHRDLIRLKALPYFLMGGEHDDLIQEGMLGLYKAVRDYDGKSSSFRNFAELCIRRQIITAAKTGARNKHMPLNTAVSFSSPPRGTGHDNDATLADVLPNQGPTPEDVVISREGLSGIIKVATTELSWLEYRSLVLWTDGHAYEVIAKRLGRDAKQIDNALQRARRKIGEHLRSSQS